MFDDVPAVSAAARNVTVSTLLVIVSYTDFDAIGCLLFLPVLDQSENHEGGSFGHHCAAGSSNEASPGQVAALSEKN